MTAISNMVNRRNTTKMYRVFMENTGLVRSVFRRFFVSHDDIADMTQETILRALEAEKRTKIDEPKGFLVGIAKNIARKELERKSRSLTDFIEDSQLEKYVSDEPAVEQVVEGRKRMHVFGQALATLPPQCQRVFILKHVYGLSHKDIGRKMNLSVSTIEKHVALGLKRSREFMRAAEAGEMDSSALVDYTENKHRAGK